MRILPTGNEGVFIRDYVLQTIRPIETFRQQYPRLVFEQLAGGLIHVEVPEGAEAELRRLEAEGIVLTIPFLFGLNAREALADANITMFHNYPFGALRGEDVIIGFADTGIDYTHLAFKNRDNTTRILRIWDQTIAGNPPSGYTYGSEYTKEQIDIALQAVNPYEIVPSRDEIGHGTFLAGVAAGDDKTGGNEFVGGAPDASIIMVKLRPAKTELKRYFLVEEPTIAYQGNDFVTALNYLLEMAVELQRPLVICIGIGNNYGAHDGTTIIERYLNTLTVVQNLILVVAAGNEANNAHHFRGNLSQVEREDIEVNVSIEEQLGFFVYLWTNISDKISVSIRSPLGQVIERVPVVSNQTRTFTLSLEQTRITINYNYPEAQTGVQNTNIRFERPTPGLWTITVYAEQIVDGIYDVWLQRTGFVAPDTRFLKPDTLITICIPSTSEYVVTVGAYDYVDQSVYVGSGRGPMADNRMKPELIAPGVNVRGPQPGGGYTTYVGTSTAAAVTAAASAILMEWAVINGNLAQMNTRIARTVLIRGARRRVGIDYPNPIEGYGRLDLRGAIANIASQ